MMKLPSTGRALACLVAAMAVTIWSRDAWAHGGWDGFGALILAILFGVPCGILLLVFAIVALVLRGKPNRGAGTVLFAKIAYWSALLSAPGLLLAQLFFEHRSLSSKALAMVGMTSVPFGAVALFCLLSARALIKKVSSAEDGSGSPHVSR